MESTVSLDMTPRYAPSQVMMSNVHAFCDVEQYVAHPANAHAHSPINNDMVALECITAFGSRWFGCVRAYINSGLRMVVIGTDPRDEVRMKWDVCTED